MAVDTRREIVRRLLEEAYGQGNLALVDELVADDARLHTELPTGPEAPSGREGFKEIVRWVRSVWPDAQVKAEDVFVDGDRVAARVTFEGTNLGPLHKYPPSGRRGRWTELFIFGISNGQVDEMWHELNVLGTLQQMGEMPDEWEMGRPPKAIVATMKFVGRTKRRLRERRSAAP